MLIDGHLHLTQKDIDNNILDIMAINNIYGLVVGTNPVEWRWLQEIANKNEHILPTYGLHPWYSDKYHLDELVPYLHNIILMGEIGMDSIWCDIDLKEQKKVFIAQMDLAEEKKCPVILHTKGQEKEIAEIIQDYTMPILVHWYSCEEFLDLYIKRDCYFTIGPDVRINKAVQQVVKKVPLNRIFVESDGISALEWVKGRKLEARELPINLIDTMKYISIEKGVSFIKVKEQMIKNLANYMSNSI